MNNFTQFQDQPSVKPRDVQQFNQKQPQTLLGLQQWEAFIRIILAATIITHIIMDIVIIIELKNNNLDKHFAIMLSFFIAPFGLTFLIKICSLIANNIDTSGNTYLQENPCLKFFFNLFSIFGLEPMFYYFQSAISMRGNIQMDKLMYSPFQTRKLQATLESIINSFVVAHYIFYYPLSSQAAVACLIFSSLNAIFAFSVQHTGYQTFVQWLNNNLFSIRFIQTFSEILGRALFFGCTALVYLKESDLQSELPYYLTFDFFISDLIAISCVCFISIFIYYWLIKFCNTALMICIQHLINSMLVRPTIDYEAIQSNSIENVRKFMTFGQIPDKQRINLIHHIVIFPAVWRIIEYVALMSVLYDEFFLYKAKMMAQAYNQDQVYNLAILTIVLNIINLTLIIMEISIIYVVPIKEQQQQQQAMNISQNLLQTLRNDVSQAGQQIGNGIRETFENCQQTISKTINHQFKNQ